MTANTIYPTGPQVGYDFTATSTTDTYGHGFVVHTNEGPVVWAKAGGTITEGQVAKLEFISSIWAAVALDTTESASEQTFVGIASKAVTSGSYGWFFRGPFDNVQVLVATTINADVTLTTTATAGTAGSGGDTILGLTTNASSGSGGLTYCRAVLPLGTNL
jgi:hypothetical protein